MHFRKRADPEAGLKRASQRAENDKCSRGPERGTRTA
jgi:hypothetical protein